MSELGGLRARFAHEQEQCGRRHSEIDELFERAERVEAAAAALGTRVDELESCLNDRGRPSAPCHGQPMHAVLDARDALDTALGGPK